MKLKSILLLSASMLVFGNSFGQSLVNTNGKKYTLIEEATGNWCGYCVDGAQVIEQSIEPNFPHAIVASWHGYAGTGDSMILTGDPIDGTGWISGFPDGLVNRDAVTFGGIEQNRGEWIKDATADSSKTPTFDISMKSWYDKVNDTIHISITATALTALSGQYNVNVFILEDSIPSTSTNTSYMQHSYFYDGGSCANGLPTWWTGLCNGTCNTNCSTCAYLPAADYYHMNVVRAMLAKGATPHGVMDQFWGDTAFIGTIAKGQTFTTTYEYKIPSTSNMVYTKVVGLVSKMGTATTDRAVQNSVTARVRLMNTTVATLGVSQVNEGTMGNINLFPNPAQNSINVTGTFNTTIASKTEIEIVNTLGQVVSDHNYAVSGSSFNETISVRDLSNGIYFMRISNSGTIAVKQFVINK